MIKLVLFKRGLLWIGLLALVLLGVACRTPGSAKGTEIAIVAVTPHTTLDTSLPPPTPIFGAQMAPDFRLPDLNGQTWTLAHFRGQPVMLFFWATW